MSKINVNYSPYRSEFRTAGDAAKKVNETVQAVTNEVIKIDINPNLLILVLFLVSILLAGLYLLNFNKIATKGYQLKRLQVSQQELKSESDLRTLYLAKVRSMNGILDDSRLNGMHKPVDVQFVYGENVLAKAD